MKLRVLAAAVTVLGISGLAFAQGPPEPRPGATTPVQVMNTPSNPVPVTLQGAVSGNVTVTNSLLNVDALNDVLNQPYTVNQARLFFGASTPVVSFDIPDGTRLIIETITARVTYDGATPANAVIQFAFTAGGFSQGGEIALQPQGAFSGPPMQYWLVGTHATKIRIDAIAGSAEELQFVLLRPAPALSGTWNVFVSGYLVPLP